MSRHVLHASVVVLTLASFAGTALAQPKPAKGGKPAAPAKPAPPPVPAGPPPLSETLTGEAKADYDAAKLLYTNSDNAGALVKFQASYDKSKDPRLLWNIAACEKNLHHYASLLAYLRRYLAEGQSVLTDAEKADAEALIKVTQPLTATLQIVATEPGARVFVDDAPVGETPLAAPVVVDVGARKVRVEKDGFEPFRADLTIGDSPRVDVIAKLEKAITDAQITVYTARPKDEVWIDGTLRGLGTWKGAVPSGTHTLRVSAPEMKPYQAEFSVREKETRTIAVTLEREPPKASGGIPAWVWIGGAAVIVAGGAVGGYFLFKPSDKPADTPVGTLDPGSVQAAFPVRFR